MKYIGIIIGIFALVFLVGCTKATTQATTQAPIVAEEPESDISQTPWQEIPLSNVHNGEEFMISDFQGKKVLIESFATWCPTCKKQQQYISELHEELGDSFVSVGLNTDPNEDEFQVKNYAEENGFTGLYSVSPVEFTTSLIDEFGTGVINAPSAPIVMVCEDQSAILLPRGLKDVEEMKGYLEKGCDA